MLSVSFRQSRLLHGTGLMSGDCKVIVLSSLHSVQLPLDVAKLGCDWLSGTSRKYLRGPRGVGFLFASRSATMLGSMNLSTLTQTS